MSEGHSKLEKYANVSIIVAAVLFVSMWGLHFLRTPQSQPSGPGLPEYLAGELLPTMEGVELRANRQSVLLFMNSQCRFCTESMPFYRSLAESQSRDYDVLAISREPLDSLRGYLTLHALRPDQTISVAENTELRLTKTPTLIVTDHTRVVRGVWLGQLTPEQEQQVRAALSMGES